MNMLTDCARYHAAIEATCLCCGREAYFSRKLRAPGFTSKVTTVGGLCRFCGCIKLPIAGPGRLGPWQGFSFRSPCGCMEAMLTWLRQLIFEPMPHSVFKVEFEDGTEAFHRIPREALRRGPQVVPALVADQRREAGLPFVPIKRIARMPGPEDMPAF